MARVSWRVFPDNITLSDPNYWQRTGQNRYRATRYYVAIEEHKLFEAKTTPPLITVPVPPGVKPVFSEKKVVVVTHFESITETVQNTVASKISTESSLKSALSLKDGFSAELQTKIGTEISESLSEQLSGTKSYQVQSTHEIMTSVAFERPDATNLDHKITYHLYLPVWPVTWNIYLYRVESLELSYRRFSFRQGLSKFLRKIRENGELETYDPRIPITQILFYEPQEMLAVQSGEYSAEIPYPDEVRLERLQIECTKTNVVQMTMSLEDCAKIAFPETEEELGLRERAKKANKKRKTSPLVSEIEKVERPDAKLTRRGLSTTRKKTHKSFGNVKQSVKSKNSQKRQPAKRNNAELSKGSKRRNTRRK
jgi:hypothetical protein